MRSFLSLLVLVPALCIGPAVQAWTLQGQVVSVVSGDTLRIRDERKVQHTVRLAGVDAPEKFQAYGQRSLDSLRELAFQRYVTVEGVGSGSPRVGRVRVEGRDISMEQLQLGAVWYDRSRAQSLPETERQAYAEAQADAKLRRVGLWRDKQPIPPWEYRAGRRK
ncbi:MAG: thermonuclease family protein [Burkholderiaceae bacterium]|jgi:endonuclease YncB( thermonuclease family)|uniref:thermonuclease family protein n=1 Tax=Hylemonella sp. TaxID=2066020 RepID=UPI0035B47008|nr:thermonuclease family protein [Burkholderiaceae bacterium]